MSQVASDLAPVSGPDLSDLGSIWAQDNGISRLGVYNRSPVIPLTIICPTDISGTFCPDPQPLFLTSCLHFPSPQRRETRVSGLRVTPRSPGSSYMIHSLIPVSPSRLIDE
ncbi:hypothetical protein RRG08_037649 [Elysia crispata]|uniref:Uncharacterized protein n=1 Tax=Elysia crispata TaxID=231223 RepID=A0AAE0YHP1_9GAST|nr:hypothetical protein RRG08_037649 [Elysia crispata]